MGSADNDAAEIAREKSPPIHRGSEREQVVYPRSLTLVAALCGARAVADGEPAADKSFWVYSRSRFWKLTQK